MFFYTLFTASYPKVSLSLSMKMCAHRMEGRRKRVRRRFTSLPFPSHGPLHYVTSHSRFMLASVQKQSVWGGRGSTIHVKFSEWFTLHSYSMSLFWQATREWLAKGDARVRGFARGFVANSRVLGWLASLSKKVEIYLCSLIPQRFQGWHSLEKSLNFRGSHWKVLKFLYKSLKSAEIFFDLKCSGLESAFKKCFLVVQDRK